MPQSAEPPRIATLLAPLVTTVLVTSVLVPTAFVIAGAASAQTAQRCEGTLCDLYYGSSAAEATPPGATPAPTPLMAPQGGILGFFSSGKPAPQGGATQAAVPALAVQGGGVVGMMNGAPQERCTGTLCDLYYGGPPPEHATPAALPQPAEAPRSARAPAGAPGLAPATVPDDDEAPVRRGRRSVEAAPREEKPRCAAPASDPWRCYR